MYGTIGVTGDEEYMKQKIFNSIMFSLEWRLYAFVITSLFLWATTGHFAAAITQAIGLQIVLLIGNSIWYYFRQEGAHGFTLDALATRLAHIIYQSIAGKQRQ